MERTELQARLEAEVMEVEWDALVPHHARGALVHVAPELPLVKVAMAVSLDFADDVQGWMATGAVMKVTEEMVEGWSEGARFRFLIVQPFVLIQPMREGRQALD
ncbi:MAG: DUF2288 family protein [Myxococcales bacterium]|nr:DUF2288 family protein [Myxococcales bacterium]